MLEVIGLTVRFDRRLIVNNINFTVEEGQWLMIAGPNGAGKSTIINAASAGVPYEGKVILRGMDIKAYKPYERARAMGVLSQMNLIGYAFTAWEIIRLGRYAYAPGIFSRQTEDDNLHISKAIDMTGVRPLLKQSALTLSGGERQRVFLAQLLAQNPALLLLDEPSNHLDLVYQKQIFTLLKEWLETPGRAIVSVVHDLSLAMTFGTRALLLDRGEAKAFGSIDEVLTPDNLNSVYDMDVFSWMNSLMGRWRYNSENIQSPVPL
ncbi:MAG: ABC transporter ATP-binding protein [Clostridiales bacterium]|jgi:iron complex transport system ATP-binding protein|nr:ABC transporter ATP-binding protein [Clostridiales bacterium]